MARITRKTLKIFALNAINNGVFGSAADGTKVLSNDPATLQSKAAWLTGWLSAVIGTKKFPALEEFQSSQYVHSYMTAYLFQEGIPEWDTGTTYYQHSVVKKTGTYLIYGSLIDSNTGNALPADGASDSNWQYLQNLQGATVPDASETVKGILKIATAALVKAGTDDLTAVTPLKLKPYGFQTGDGKENWGTALHDGFIWAAGRTIGNAASNGTERANADTVDLYTLLWNAYPYSGATAVANSGQLQVYTSGGTAVARGASAAADYAANRAISVPDKRGRASFGKDDMGGTPAGRLSGQPFGINGLLLGGAGGQELHTPTLAEMFAHAHDGSSMATATWSHTHAVSNSLINNNNPSAPFNWHANSGSSPTTAEALGATTTSVTSPALSITGNTGISGGGNPFNVINPGIVCNYMIKL